MKMKIIPFLVILTCGVTKFAVIYTTHHRFELISWVLFSAMWLWITWAYWKNQDMPARAGNFDYKNGENDFPRTMYAIAMVACYFIGVVWA